MNVLNHLMVELYSLDDVGQGYDLALMDREKIVATLGRHSNDLMTSFYMRTPSEFFVEYGWGGRNVDDATWQPHEVDTLASFWGHDGLVRAVGGEDPPLEVRHQFTEPAKAGAGSGDRWQLRAHQWRVPLVGCRKSAGSGMTIGDDGPLLMPRRLRRPRSRWHEAADPACP